MDDHRASDTGSVKVSRDVMADPAQVWELVSDLPRMGQWSPEATGGRWLGGATGASRGARFAGRNRRGWRRWSTLATVVECDPGSSFAFDVTSGPIRVARWRYDIVAIDGGCRVTESWEDQRPGFFAWATSFVTGVHDRARQNRENMSSTLAALARTAEGGT